MLSAVLGILSLTAACTNPLLDRVTSAVEVATGPRMALCAGATDLQSGGVQGFGSVYIGGSLEKPFTIRNTGKADLILSGGAPVAISGTDVDQFRLSAPPGLDTIPIGQSTTFTLCFSPTSVGAKTATVTVESNDPGMSVFTLTVEGTGLYNGTVSRPKFNPGQGTVRPEQTVSIECLTTGATIYYTVDGSDPAVSTARIFDPAAPIALMAGVVTIKAMGVKAGMEDSTVVNGFYLIDPYAPGIPVIQSVMGGHGAVTVTWGAADMAGEYKLYWAPGATAPEADASWVDVVAPSVTGTVTGLADATGYAFAVTTINTHGESPQSQAATANTAVAIPVFSPAAGGYIAWQNVTISCATGGSSIRYTTDGTEPSETVGTEYASEVGITSPTTLKAIASKSGFPSTSAAAEYAFTLPGAPDISSAAGGDRQVTVTWGEVAQGVSYNVYCNPGADVTTTDYATMGTTTGLTMTITGLSDAVQYAFIVTAEGGAGESPASGIETASTMVAMPVFSPDAGHYGDPQTVAIGTSTSGASIRYTTDGSTPSAGVGMEYTGPVSVSTTGTLKAVAYKSGFPDSAVATAAYDLPGSIWTARTLPVADNWNSVVHGNGLFVAVASYSSNAATSPDGIAWTARTLPCYGQWHVVAYGAERFVTVSYANNDSAVSSDGVTWTAGTLPGTVNWYALAYGNGRFLAIARSSTMAATSSDGITWTARTLPNSYSWRTLTFGNGFFVTTAGGTCAARSADGETWELGVLPSNAAWQCVTFGAGVFVAVAQNSSTAATSTDGINWTARTLPGSANWYGVGYGDGVFVAVTTSGNNLAATSSDGITWTARTLPSSASWLSVCHGNDRFVAVSTDDSNRAATSP